MAETVDYAIRQFLYKLFVPRPGKDRIGRNFALDDLPSDYDWRGSEAARKAQQLFVRRCISKKANPSADVYQVEDETGHSHMVRMQWLRLYWQPVSRQEQSAGAGAVQQ